MHGHIGIQNEIVHVLPHKKKLKICVSFYGAFFAIKLRQTHSVFFFKGVNSTQKVSFKLKNDHSLTNLIPHFEFHS